MASQQGEKASAASHEKQVDEATPHKPQKELYPMVNWKYDLFVFVIGNLVDAFFKEVVPRGSWRVPQSGPVLFVAAPHANQVRPRSRSRSHVIVMPVLTPTVLLVRRRVTPAADPATRSKPPRLSSYRPEIRPWLYRMGFASGWLGPCRPRPGCRETGQRQDLSSRPDKRPDSRTRCWYKVWRGRGRGTRHDLSPARQEDLRRER